jgi:transcriptional regulator with GAF, ATPase, and Fis domain
MGHFPAGVCMHESNAQVGRAVSSPRQQVNNPSQVARAVQNAISFNANKNPSQQNASNSDAGAGVANSHRLVMVWESQTTRLKLIDRVVSDCGAHAYRVEEWDDVEKASCSSCCAAVIALGTYQTDDALASKIIRRMKQVGLTVIAHERGAHSWSVGLRCRALLAGASCVLDSEEAGFSQTLQRILTGVLAQKTCELGEKKRIHEQMRTFGIVGESDAIEVASRQALRIGSLSDLAVLITGESGTGKELMARAIHQLDPKRSTGPFVAVNCGAISSGLAESELFGHSRGAFTGADRDRKGLIRAADGGVLFLDEIGDLGSDMQAKLLRVLQDHRVLSVGTDHDVGVNVRVIAATNRNLELMMERGEFRADLFHRLNMFSIYLPPLRERVADLKSLIENFLMKFRSIAKIDISSVDRDFIEALAQLDLPGNVRQLENIVRRAALNKTDDTPLSLSDLPPEVWRQLCAKKQMNGGKVPVDLPCNPNVIPDAPLSSTECITPLFTRLDSKGWNLSRVVEYCEGLLVEAALQRTQGNHSQAARVLGITPRTLYNKLKKPHHDSEP